MNENLRPFRNRRQAGQALAERLRNYADRADVVVLALPRGGVTVAAEVASALQAPLDVFVVRKLGTPGQPELAMGAIATGGVRVLNDDLIRMLNLPAAAIDRVAEVERRELERRERLYRAGRPFPEIAGKIIVLVDDGLATGATMRAAIKAIRQLHPSRVVVAVPTGAADTCEAFRSEADDVVCLIAPRAFRAVALWYEEFSQVSDEEVRELLEHSAHEATVRER